MHAFAQLACSVFPDVDHLPSLHSSSSGFFFWFSGEPLQSASYLMWRKGGTGGHFWFSHALFSNEKQLLGRKWGEKYAQAMFFRSNNIGDDVK